MDQLLREWPPGFGGVERVAHALAVEEPGKVFSLQDSQNLKDSVSVNYHREALPSFALGRLLLPLPSYSLFHLLISRRPLIVHLPCPSVLFLASLAKVIRPGRSIKVYWHAFLEQREGIVGLCEQTYQWIAILMLRFFPAISTSPVLIEGLQAKGISAARINFLPCALTPEAEDSYGLIWEKRKELLSSSGTIIFIGRLDSYKRVDWLIRIFPEISSASQLLILGEGPYRSRLELLAKHLLRPHQVAHFFGRVNETRKQELLARADVLVLPSAQSNEAFGIVQLEAMACGVPAFSFANRFSGMFWVSRLPGLAWTGNPNELAPLLQHLLVDSDLYRLAANQARSRYEQNFAVAIWRKRFAAIREGNVD